jgi:hypothetical protein
MASFPPSTLLKAFKQVIEQNDPIQSKFSNFLKRVVKSDQFDLDAEGNYVVDLSSGSYDVQADNRGNVSQEPFMLAHQTTGTCYIHAAMNAIMNSSIRTDLEYHLENLLSSEGQPQGTTYASILLRDVIMLRDFEFDENAVDHIYSLFFKTEKDHKYIRNATLLALLKSSGMHGNDKFYNEEFANIDLLYSLLSAEYIDIIKVHISSKAFLDDMGTTGGSHQAASFEVMTSLLGLEYVQDAEPLTIQNRANEERSITLHSAGILDACMVSLNSTTILSTDKADIIERVKQGNGFDTSGIISWFRMDSSSSSVGHAIAYARYDDEIMVIDSNGLIVPLHDYYNTDLIFEMTTITPSHHFKVRQQGGLMTTITPSARGVSPFQSASARRLPTGKKITEKYHTEADELESKRLFVECLLLQILLEAEMRKKTNTISQGGAGRMGNWVAQGALLMTTLATAIVGSMSP